MPSRKASGPPRGPGRGTKMTIGFGLVNVQVRYGPLVKSDTGRASATTCCREHGAPVQTEYRCTAGGELVDRADKAMLYEVDGRFVEVDTGALGLDRDAVLQLTAHVERESIPPLYFETPYAIWPEDGAVNEQAFDLIAAALHNSGKVLVGTTVMNKATRAIVVEWSEEAGCLLAYRCTYDERIAWDKVAVIRQGIENAPAPNEQMLAVADTILGQLPAEFDFGGISDEYAVQLDEAIERASAGLPPLERAPEPEAAPVIDLMAALQASVSEATAPKKKAAAKKPAAKKPKVAA